MITWYCEYSSSWVVFCLKRIIENANSATNSERVRFARVEEGAESELNRSPVEASYWIDCIAIVSTMRVSDERRTW